EELRGVEHPLEPLRACSGGGFARAIPGTDDLVPGALVVAANRVFDLWVLDDQEAPPLHVAAGWGRDTCFQNFTDQLFRYRVCFQAAHRARCAHDLEDVVGFRHRALPLMRLSHKWPARSLHTNQRSTSSSGHGTRTTCP